MVVPITLMLLGSSTPSSSCGVATDPCSKRTLRSLGLRTSKLARVLRAVLAKGTLSCTWAGKGVRW